MAKLIHFLLVYDHDAGALIAVPREFTSADDAVAAYREAETLHEDRDRIEVVLIGAESLATVRHTHANYFDGTVTSPYLVGL